MKREWPGSGPVHLFLAHATGFCKEVWDPVVETLRSADRPGPITTWDAPGHGASATPAVPFDWWEGARAALEVVGGGSGPRIGVGHSMGGATLVMCQLLAPGTFDRLVLIEPIIFPPPFRRHEQNHLSSGAQRRRATFATPAVAREHFAGKDAFRTWNDGALRGYVEGGLVEHAGTWRLACAPAFEAEVYRGGSAHDSYRRLPEIECPVLILAGEFSATHPADYVSHLSEQFPESRFRIIPQAGHFLPMERPDIVAGQITDEMRQFEAG